MRVRSRRPRFGDVVVLEPHRYRVAASTIFPTRGFWLRPDGAADASRDRFLPLPEWSVLAFCTLAQRWEVA
jgi:hypothetical protein